MLKVALIQMLVKSSKTDNLHKAVKHIKNAAQKGAKLICLPECFNSLYGVKHFRSYSEEVPNGETCRVLSKVAKDEKIWLVGGSIPESRDGSLFNTSVVYNPEGDLVGTYSKIHLFDINVPGKIVFQESEVLSAGNKLLSFDVPTGPSSHITVGVGICYDVRFPELAHLYSRSRGCRLILYPGAFNMTTGPVFWELLGRARAVDNQCYVGLCSIARDPSFEYVAYGHSLAVGPWGTTIDSLTEEEGILEFEVDSAEIDNVRSSIPITRQRREDVYSVAMEKK